MTTPGTIMPPRWPVFPVYEPTEAGRCSCGDATCATPGKHPRVKWQEAATTDPAQLTKWKGQWPRANSGIPTGARSGLVVLDIDPRHGGDESLAELERDCGSLPQTPRQITGSGGTHHLFAHPGGDVRIPNRQELRPGIDVRGDGGYIVGPGSRHASGGVYQWDAGAHPDDVPLAPLPGWLLTMLAGPPTSSEPLPEGSRGVPLPIGRKAHDFVESGAAIGSQRGTAVAAARNLLSAGRSVDETADLLWQGFRASAQESGRAPWTYKDAQAIALDISKSPPPPLAERTNGRRPAELLPDHSNFPYTDTGNAERFAARYGDRAGSSFKRKYSPAMPG